MERYYGRLKNLRARVAFGAAAFATSATLLLAVLSAFYSVSSEALLADSPEARSALAGCESRGDDVARRHCVLRLVARAQARDAGASQVAAVAARRRGPGQ
jgi:hypothetical protein